MSVEVRNPWIPGMGQGSVRPDRIAVGAVLVVAVALSAASLVTDPTSVLTLAMAALYGAVGTLLTVRRPRNPIGWLLLGVLLVFAALVGCRWARRNGRQDRAPHCPAGCRWP